MLKEELHRMSDWSIELTPQRVKASQPWAITGAQVLGGCVIAFASFGLQLYHLGVKFPGNPAFTEICLRF